MATLVAQARWIGQAAKKVVLPTHAELQASLQEIAGNHNEEHKGRSQRHYIYFSPPPIDALLGEKMCPTLLSDSRCGVRVAFSMTAELAPSTKRVTLKNHTLTGMAPTASTAPCYSHALGKGKGRGKGKGNGKAVPWRGRG